MFRAHQLKFPATPLLNRPEIAVLASTSLLYPICLDFMQYIFGIFEIPLLIKPG